MTSSISFHAGQTIYNLAGSGLGFFGSGFGTSVAVGAYQDSTFICDANGTIQGPQANNVKWTHANSGSINGAATLNLLNVPNSLAPLNIRFTNDSAVRTQNAKLYIYDRSSINNDPSGVVVKVAEIIHPSDVQTGLTGSGDSTFITAKGSGTTVDFVASPAMSGLSQNGAQTTDTRHDWYAVISCSPSTIGAKTFAAYFETEYL